MLSTWNETAYSAFWELLTERSMGFGVEGPIPFSAIDRYATRMLSDSASFRSLHEKVRHLEKGYREIKEKNKAGK